MSIKLRMRFALPWAAGKLGMLCAAFELRTWAFELIAYEHRETIRIAREVANGRNPDRT